MAECSDGYSCAARRHHRIPLQARGLWRRACATRDEDLRQRCRVEARRALHLHVANKETDKLKQHVRKGGVLSKSKALKQVKAVVLQNQQGQDYKEADQDVWCKKFGDLFGKKWGRDNLDLRHRMLEF